MDLVGQMYRLSACFDTPNEYKGLPYDYFPEDAVTYGSTVCSFGLPYNDHNYGMPTGLTPPVMAPHLMDPAPKPKKAPNNLLPIPIRGETAALISGETNINDQQIKAELEVQFLSTDPNDFNNPSMSCTPRKQYLDENDYPIYVEPEIKVVEVPEELCVSASEYSDCTTDSSDDESSYNPDFIIYLRSLTVKHPSVERYLSKAKRRFEQYATSQKSSGSEKRDCSMTSDFVIDCICEFPYDDRRMVQCESCGVRQHIDCMYANPRGVQNFLKHRCHKCSDIKVDVSRAKAIQSSRKNWNMTTMQTDKMYYRGKSKSEDSKKNKDLSLKEEKTLTDFNKLNSKSLANRVNKRKQDLKAYAENEKNGDDVPQTPASVDDENGANTSTTNIRSLIPESNDFIGTNEHTESAEMKIDDNASFTDELPNKTSDGTDAPNLIEEYAERLALLNRRSQPLKKDYKEATKSLYSNNLLTKVENLKESEEEKQSILATSNIEGLEHGTEFLDRNPRCRIVLFDSCTIGLEASVRLQSGSIVAAMVGKMMLMEEYLAYANPTTECRPYVFLYHNFADRGIAIDCTSYGNITRYLRRSCDPNVKLDHMIVGGTLYIVVRTINEICQGVELTIPFDVPFEMCQYPVQCACGKVRCPAVKHRRKHHRNRIITANINCEQVIEDKLRELSQPLSSTPAAYPNSVTCIKKPIIPSRYGLPLRPIFPCIDSQDIKTILPNSHDSDSNPETPPFISEDQIKKEQMEPDSQSDTEESEYPTPSKGFTAELSGDAILTTKRQRKPIVHPDFEVDLLPKFSDRIKPKSMKRTDNSKMKTEPTMKKHSHITEIAAKSIKLSGQSQKTIKEETLSSSGFKSIILTRRQKQVTSNESPQSKRSRFEKEEPTIEETVELSAPQPIVALPSSSKRKSRYKR